MALVSTPCAIGRIDWVRASDLDGLLFLEVKLGDLIQFRPRAKYASNTDFPTITAKANADFILGLDKNLKAQATEIMNVIIVEGPHDNAIWGENGFIPKEPA